MWILNACCLTGICHIHSMISCETVSVIIKMGVFSATPTANCFLPTQNCLNGGLCVASPTAPGTGQCQCPAGFTGPRCSAG